MKEDCHYFCYRNTREPIEFIKTEFKKIKLAVFDMDGVLTDIISSWKYIHDYFKTSNERSVNEYLKGNIDDMEFIRRDANLWIEDGKAIKEERLIEILSDVPLMQGAVECIDFLNKNKIKTAIISAGLDVLAEDVAEKLGIDHVYSNGVKTDKEGRLTGIGKLGVELMYKDKSVIKLSKKLSIPQENIVSVGNSCFDIPMFQTTGLGIAFNPSDDCTRNAADIVVEGRDLKKIIPYLKSYI